MLGDATAAAVPVAACAWKPEGNPKGFSAEEALLAKLNPLDGEQPPNALGVAAEMGEPNRPPLPPPENDVDEPANAAKPLQVGEAPNAELPKSVAVALLVDEDAAGAVGVVATVACAVVAAGDGVDEDVAACGAGEATDTLPKENDELMAAALSFFFLLPSLLRARFFGNGRLRSDRIDKINPNPCKSTHQIRRSEPSTCCIICTGGTVYQPCKDAHNCSTI